MITTLKYPSALEFARNNVFLRLQSDNYLTSAGVNANVDFIVSPSPAADNTFTLAWTSDISHSVTLTFKASPDNSGKQLPLRITSPSTEPMITYAERILTAIEKNQEIYKDFILTRSGTTPAQTINLTSRLKNVSGCAASKYGTYLAVTNTAAGTLLQVRPNFKALVEIYERDQNTGADTYLGTKSASPDEAGIMVLDLSPQLLPRFNPSVTWPQADLVKARPDMVNKYYCRSAEQYGADPVVYGMNTHPIFNAVYGGAGKLKIGSLNATGETLYNEHVVTRQRALTFHPIIKTVDRYQPEKLFWYNYTGTGTLKTRITALYTGGQTAVNTAVFPSLPINGIVYEFNLTPDKLFNLYTWPGYTGSKIYCFKFDIINSLDVPVMEQRSYYIDTLYYQENKYFVFLNSPGGFDTLRCVGSYEKTAQYSRSEAVKVLTFDFTNSAAETVDYDIQETQVYKASTGWLTLSGVSGKQMADYLRELLLSPMVYQLTTGGMERIKLLTGEAFIHSEDQHLYAINFEYRKTFTDRLYSPSNDDSQAVDNAFFGTGFGIGFQISPQFQIILNKS